MANPKKSQQLEIRNVEREVLAHDPVNEKIHVLNGTAAQVLELCDGAHSAADIAHSITTLTGADLAVVSADVDAILCEFIALDLVSIVEPDVGSPKPKIPKLAN